MARDVCFQRPGGFDQPPSWFTVTNNCRRSRLEIRPTVWATLLILDIMTLIFIPPTAKTQMSSGVARGGQAATRPWLAQVLGFAQTRVFRLLSTPGTGSNRGDGVKIRDARV